MTRSQARVHDVVGTPRKAGKMPDTPANYAITQKPAPRNRAGFVVHGLAGEPRSALIWSFLRTQNTQPKLVPLRST